MRIYVQHLRATLDVNGNPRRAWRVMVDGPGSSSHPMLRTVAVVDEGYSVTSPSEAVREAVASSDLLTDASWDGYVLRFGESGEECRPIEVPSVNVTPAQYRDAVTQGERLDRRNPWRVVWDDGDLRGYYRSESRARADARAWCRTFGNGRQRAERNV